MLKVCFLFITSFFISDVVYPCVLKITKNIKYHKLPFLGVISKYNDDLIAIGGMTADIYIIDSEVNIKDSNKVDINNSFNIKAIDIQEIGDKNKIVFIGGDKSERIDTGVVFGLDDKTNIYRDFSALYKMLAIKTNTKVSDDMNLSGITSDKNNVYMISSSNIKDDFIFSIPKDKFERYLIKDELLLDDVYTYPVDLPSKSGAKSHLSSITIDKKEKMLHVTTVIEKKGIEKNSILGNYYGVISLKHLKPGRRIKLNYDAIEIKHKNKSLLTKIKDIVITSNKNEKVKGILLSNNLDGTSDLFDFSFEK